MSEFVVYLQNVENISNINSNLVKGIILADKQFSSAITTSSISKQDIELIHQFKYRAFVKMDRLFEEEELDVVREYLMKLESFNVDEVIYTDIAIKVLIEELGLKLNGIYAPETLLTNYCDIESLKAEGVSGCVISKDIPLRDVYMVIQNVPGYCSLRIHGPILVAYSRRQYINAYLDSNKEYLKNYFLQEETRESKLPIIEKSTGNWLYASCLQSFSEIKYLKDSPVVNLLIDNCFYEDEYTLKVVDLYDAVVNNLLSPEQALENLKQIETTIDYMDINELRETWLDKEKV